ncbi:hypothetical protein HX049_16580 [Myroides odoratimimus]|uniref:hypothetical protein n=1 Tax=Myroides odoratimimus TaxID=76832 RepID=UPI002576AD82|nr:hypothetical protein [Myroides odoratimimus]MDM1398764.1 hypothetical protein [Myroides odoratimimus]
MKGNLTYLRVKKSHLKTTAYVLNTSDDEIELMSKLMKKTLYGIVLLGLLSYIILSQYFDIYSFVYLFIVAGVLIFGTVFYLFEVRKALGLRKLRNDISIGQSLQASWVTIEMLYSSLNNFYDQLIIDDILSGKKKKDTVVIENIELSLRSNAEKNLVNKRKWLTIIGAITILFLGTVWKLYIDVVGKEVPFNTIF